MYVWFSDTTGIWNLNMFVQISDTFWLNISVCISNCLKIELLILIGFSALQMEGPSRFRGRSFLPLLRRCWVRQVLGQQGHTKDKSDQKRSSCSCYSRAWNSRHIWQHWSPSTGWSKFQNSIPRRRKRDTRGCWSGTKKLDHFATEIKTRSVVTKCSFYSLCHRLDFVTYKLQ